MCNGTCACHSSSKSCCNSWHTMSHWKEKSLDQWAFHVLANWMATLDGGPELIPILGAKRNPTIEGFYHLKRSLNATRKRPLRLSRKRHRMGSRNLKEGGDHADPQGHCPPHVELGTHPWVTLFKSFPTTFLQMSCIFAGRGEQICCCSWIKPLLKQSSYGTRHKKPRSITTTRLPEATQQPPLRSLKSPCLLPCNS